MLGLRYLVWKFISTKTCVGEPIIIGDITLIQFRPCPLNTVGEQRGL